MRVPDIRRRVPRVMPAAVVVAALGISACDFDVANPGPVKDESINADPAHQGLVNGAVRAFGDGLGSLYVGDGIVHGHMPSGHTGSAGTEPEEEVAILNAERDGSNGGWRALHRGRWIGEEAVRRFEATVTDHDSYPLKAQAHFWAGMANRVLGENMCTAVFDGGEPMPKTAYFERAIDHFNKAEAIARRAGLTTGANDFVTASIGARAAANLFLGKTAAARTDAAKVPFAFKFTTRYTGSASDPNYYLATGVASLAFQSISMWGTPAHPHFLMTGDSRVAWGYDNGTREIPAGQPFAVRGQTHPSRPSWNALVPMYYPLKMYAPRKPASRELLIFEPNLTNQRTIQVNLVTGREMALVLAELDLMDGDWQSAMTRINSVRTTTPVYQANLATAMDLKLHTREEADRVRENMPVYFTGTPGDFSAGGMMPPVSASNLEEAWAALKFERYLELSLEMRRFGDRWRWRQNKTPGALHPLEYLDAKLTKKYNMPADPLNLCFPLIRDENDANDKVPADFKDWTGP